MLENAACLACLANYGFSGWEMSLSQSPWCGCGAGGGEGGGGGEGQRPLGRGWRGARGLTTRRFGRAILSAVDSPVRQVRSVATQDVTTGQGVVVLKGSDHGSKLAAAKALQATEGSRVLLCTAAGQAVRGRVAQYARFSRGQRPTMLIVTFPSSSAML